MKKDFNSNNKFEMKGCVNFDKKLSINNLY